MGYPPYRTRGIYFKCLVFLVVYHLVWMWSCPFRDSQLTWLGVTYFSFESKPFGLELSPVKYHIFI
jgi:hypothetical protein